MKYILLTFFVCSLIFNVNGVSFIQDVIEEGPEIFVRFTDSYEIGETKSYACDSMFGGDAAKLAKIGTGAQCGKSNEGVKFALGHLCCQNSPYNIEVALDPSWFSIPSDLTEERLTMSMNVPSFNFTTITLPEAYQDAQGTLVIGDLAGEFGEGGDPNYFWRQGDTDSPYQPENTSPTLTVNYWDFPEGANVIQGYITVQGYPLFYYHQEASFKVLSSCVVSCKSITFRTTNNIGFRNSEICPTCKDLVTGETAEDEFDCVITDKAVTMTYKAGSRGGTPLTLNKQCFLGPGSLTDRGINLPACGVANDCVFCESGKYSPDDNNYCYLCPTCMLYIYIYIISNY